MMTPEELSKHLSVNWHSGKPKDPQEGDAYINSITGSIHLYTKGGWGEIVQKPTVGYGTRIAAELTPTIEWPDPEKFVDEMLQRKEHDPEFLQELKAL